VTPSFDFYDKPGYLQELTHCSRQAGKGDSLTIMAMGYDVTVPAVNMLSEELAAAAKRGASIRLIIDACSFMLDDRERLGPLFYNAKIVPGKLRGSFKKTYDMLEHIKLQGGQYYITNQPGRAFTFPYGGRSHIKLAIVNDRFFIGGCNLDDTTYLDVMVAWQNRPTVEALSAILQKVIDDDGHSVRQALEDSDQTLVLGDKMKIFIDCGIRHQSTILRQAHQLIDEAREKVTITCQYFPGEETARRLLAARKRGVDVKIYFSHPTVHGKLFFVHHFYNLRERLSLPAVFFENRLAKDIPKLHSKVIVTESAAMIGSHNYVSNGVNYGTAEIALLNHDPAFAKTLEKRVRQLVTR
jgi:phosphatidylserine/phosphatidylglycerophosphate/cardiolipin synthase-like enzyme